MKRFVFILAIALGLSPASACECPTANDVATFDFGSAVNTTGDQWEVPCIVECVESVTFTQMRINYDAADGDFIDARADVKNLQSLFVDNVVNGANSYVVIQVAGGYGAGECDFAPIYATFERASSSVPVDLAYHTVEGGPNSYCHLNYTGGGDGKITPSSICFETGSAKPARDTWSMAKLLYR